MLSSAIRVLARAAAIQLEEASLKQSTATSALACSSSSLKGKGRAVDVDSAVHSHVVQDEALEPTSEVEIPYQTLSEALTRSVRSAHTPPAADVGPSSFPTKPKTMSALDRMIAKAPRSPPPPGPSTPPKPPAAQRMRSDLEKRIWTSPSTSTERPSPSASASTSRATATSAERPTGPKAPQKSTGEGKKKGKSALDLLIEASPRQNPPPAPDTPPRPPGRQAMRSTSSESPIPALSVATASSTPAATPEPSPQTSAVPYSSPVTHAEPEELPFVAPPSATSSVDAVASSAGAGLKLDPLEATEEHVAVTKGLDGDLTPTRLEQEQEDVPVLLRASKVPSSRIGRLFHYGSLAASLSFGAASESIRRTTGGNKNGGSVFMSDANVRRLVATLGRMRGAALKLGQFMSIQDNNMLPPEIEKVLHQVQAHANYMPDWQMERVMRDELGADWQSLFSSFDRTPVASASIGQVHRATLSSTGLPVAVKIQFPGVASSIESDLANLSLLLRSSALLPKGLYLQNTIAVMKRELEDECDYVREAASGKKFAELLKGDEFFVVPKVVEEATTGKVLTTEWMRGKPLSRVRNLSQATRDQIGTNILRLCLQELFQFRFMQTDPNWANFMYLHDAESNKDQIQLIDFGASREYTKEFMDGWYRLLKSALEGDREVMKRESEKLGYLTGEENEVMLNAHLDSMALVASPFAHKGDYEFASQTITESVRALIPIMLKYRLTPPPQETYSLNRKLSGCFLMCAKLGARVDCQKLWDEVVGGYQEG